MKCPNCGAEIENSKTCSYCGSAITAKMMREQENTKKAGCPSCGSTNIQFRRENHGEVRGKKSKQNIYRTVGYCKDCGETWYSNSTPPAKKTSAPTWLWVLGWLLCFPIPLTVLMLRNKKLPSILKYAIIVIGWLLYIVVFFGAKRSNSEQPSSVPSSAVQDVPASEPLSQYDVLDYFAEQYNKIAKYPMSNPLDIDIQAPEYYRTEFRLNSFKDAIAREYSVGDTTIDIVLYGPYKEKESIRFYLATKDAELASGVLEPMLKTLDPALSSDEISKGIEYIKENSQAYYLDDGIDFYFIPSQAQMFLDCKNIDFYKNK